MALPTRETAHVDKGVKRLLSQFYRATKFRGIVATYLERLQGAEDTLWTVIDAVSIDAAEGALLRALGKIVGAGQGNLTEALFRVRIRVRVRVNRSAGTVEDLLDVFRLATTGIAGATAELVEFYPASMILSWSGPIDPTVSAVVFAALREAKASGVRLGIVYPGDTGGDATDEALFGPSDSFVVDAVHGASYDAGSTYGGILSGSVSTAP